MCLVSLRRNSPEAVGFTFSDLTQRLLPTLVLDAYPDEPVTPKRAFELLAAMKPTPPFRDGGAR